MNRHPTPRAGLLTMLLLSAPLCAQEAPHRLTILHTNDMHSHLLGFAPNRDATPLSPGDDATRGGISRLAARIQARRAQAPERTLVLDAGDWMMGTLFQTIATRHAAELTLLGQIGYDAVVPGNHDFDFGPGGLASVIEAARQAGPIPAVLLANGVSAPDDPGDDALERLFADQVLRPRLILERGGLKVGLFGLMGKHAASVAPGARPYGFTPPAAAARAEVAALRAAGAQVVICLSHGGVVQRDGVWGGPDVDLVREAPGIDVVISGHTHTPVPEPIQVGDAVIVQAGSFGVYLGALELEVVGGKVRVSEYQLIPVDDSLAGAESVEEQVAGYEQRVEREVLAPLGLGFHQVLAEAPFDLVVDRRDPGSSNLAPLVTDAIRWGIDRACDTPTDVVITTAGLIRGDMLRGESGLQETYDLFRILPLGEGQHETTPGYPLARIWLTAQELKSLVEVMLVGYRIYGPVFYPCYAGLRYHVNRRRVPLDQVYRIELLGADGGARDLDLSGANHRLYSLGLSSYSLRFVHMIGELSHGLFQLVPKRADGTPMESLDEAILDADPTREGIQEVKEWRSLIGYLQSFPDPNGDGIPEVPERYRRPPPREVIVASWDPRLLFGNATRVTAAVWVSPILLVGLPGGWWLRRRRRRASSAAPAAD